jgi:hypothetical protein
VEQPTVSPHEQPVVTPHAAEPPPPHRRRPSSAAILAWVCVAVGLGALGCAQPRQRPVIAVPAAHSEGEERPGLMAPFELSSRPDDAVVRIVTDVTCTGTLIAEDLVLTAHHCVAARDSKGKPTHEDRAPDDITVEIGGDYLPWGEVSVRAIVSPDCGYTSGDGDIAILVLSRKLIGITTMVPRMSSGPKAPDAKAESPEQREGELVTPVGFGRCASSAGGIHRVWRPNGRVRSVQPGHFVAPASICPGDSGAPAYSIPTGQIVGVVSSSVMDADENTVGTSYFTRLDVWKNLFSAAREIANGASPSELPPFRSCASH